MASNKLSKFDWEYYKRRYPEYLKNDGVIDMSRILYDILMVCESMKPILIKMFDVNNVLKSEDGVDYIDYITGIKDYYNKSKQYRSSIGSLEASSNLSDGYYNKLESNDDIKDDIEHLESYNGTSMKHWFKDNADLDGCIVSKNLEQYKYWNDEMVSQVLDFIGQSFGVSRTISIRWLANTPEYGGTVYYEDGKDKDWHPVKLNNYNYLKLIRFQIIKNNTDGSRQDMNNLYKSIDLPISIYNSPAGDDLVAELHFELKYLNNADSEYNVNYMDRLMFLNGYYDMNILGVSITRFASFADYVSNYAMLANEYDTKEELLKNDFSSPSKFAAIWFDVENVDNDAVFDVANKNSEVESNFNKHMDEIEGYVNKFQSGAGTPTFDKDKKNPKADYYVIGYGVWN